MRVQGVAPNFQPPSRQTPSGDMWLTIVLCIFLPPIGLIRLWMMARCPLRGKFIISIIALLSLTLMLTVFISLRQQNAQLLEQNQPDVPPTISESTPTPAPISVENQGGTVIQANPAQNAPVGNAVNSQLESSELVPEDETVSDIIPANPVQ